MKIEELKRAVRARDGFRCTVCGLTDEDHRRKHRGKSLHVHRVRPGDGYTVAGCVTVCYKCHGRKHAKPGRQLSLRVSDACASALDALCFDLDLPVEAVLEIAIFGLSRDKPMRPSEIKAIRESLQMTQEEFARRLGLATKGAVSLLESGKRQPTGPVLLLLQGLASEAKKSRKNAKMG